MVVVVIFLGLDWDMGSAVKAGHGGCGLTYVRMFSKWSWVQRWVHGRFVVRIVLGGGHGGGEIYSMAKST